MDRGSNTKKKPGKYTENISQMIDGAGGIGPRHWKGRRGAGKQKNGLKKW